MESRARLMGHSLHQILIVFPLGLFTTSVGFDVMSLLTHEARWVPMAYYTMIVGLVGGLAAALAGYIDYRAIPAGTRAKSVGAVHGVSSFVTLVLFAVSAVVRAQHPTTLSWVAFTLSIAGILLASLAGWLGGELVTRMGIGVADGAHPDAGMTQFGIFRNVRSGRSPSHLFP